jgi:hypothetical protein
MGSRRTRIRVYSRTTTLPSSSTVSSAGKLASNRESCRSGFLSVPRLKMITDGLRWRLSVSKVPKSVSAESTMRFSSLPSAKILSSSAACNKVGKRRYDLFVSYLISDHSHNSCHRNAQSTDARDISHLLRVTVIRVNFTVLSERNHLIVYTNMETLASQTIVNWARQLIERRHTQRENSSGGAPTGNMIARGYKDIPEVRRPHRPSSVRDLRG